METAGTGKGKYGVIIYSIVAIAIVAAIIIIIVIVMKKKEAATTGTAGTTGTTGTTPKTPPAVDTATTTPKSTATDTAMTDEATGAIGETTDATKTGSSTIVTDGDLTVGTGPTIYPLTAPSDGSLSVATAASTAPAVVTAPLPLTTAEASSIAADPLGDTVAVMTEAKRYYDNEGEWHGEFVMRPRAANRVYTTMWDVAFFYEPAVGSEQFVTGEDRRRFEFEVVGGHLHAIKMYPQWSGTTLE